MTGSYFQGRIDGKRIEYLEMLVEYIERQREWSLKTFGPGRRTEGILKHIATELDEVREAPEYAAEWIDIIILALDGAWRTGATAMEIILLLEDKQRINFSRRFPYPESEDHMSEHVKD